MIPAPTTPHEAEALMGSQVITRDGRVLRLDGYTGSGQTWRVESGGETVDLASCRAPTPDELASLAAARAAREAESDAPRRAVPVQRMGAITPLAAVRHYVDAVLQVFGLHEADLQIRGRGRNHPVRVAARHTLWRALRDHTTLSTPEIGAVTGHAHNTVVLALGMWDAKAAKDPAWNERLARVAAAAQESMGRTAERRPGLAVKEAGQ